MRYRFIEDVISPENWYWMDDKFVILFSGTGAECRRMFARIKDCENAYPLFADKPIFVDDRTYDIVGEKNDCGNLMLHVSRTDWDDDPNLTDEEGVPFFYGVVIDHSIPEAVEE